MSGRQTLAERARGLVLRRPLLAKVVENASWLLLERVVLLVVAFFVNVWFVRYLGPVQFGQYSYALSFAALFAAIAALGMDTVVVRELTRCPEEEGEILGTALRLRTAAGVVAWLATAVAAFPAREDALTRWLIGIVGANSVFIGAGVFDFQFQARIRAKRVVLVRLGIALAAQAARIALIAAGAPLWSFAALFVANGAGTAAATWVLYKAGDGRGRRLSWSGRWVRVLLADSWPMVFVALSIATYLRIDQVILAALAGDRENGIYAPAAALSELWYFIPVAIGGSAYPVIVKARAEMTPELFERKMQGFYDGMAAVAYAIAIPIALAAGPIVRIMYGADFARAGDVLRVHVLSLVLVSLGFARGRYLIAANHIRFTLVATMSGAIVNVGLNLLLVPRWGALGAAWAKLGGYLASDYLSGFVWKPVWRQTALVTRALLLPLRIPSYLGMRRGPRPGETQGGWGT